MEYNEELLKNLHDFSEYLKKSVDFEDKVIEGIDFRKEQINWENIKFNRQT